MTAEGVARSFLIPPLTCLNLFRASTNIRSRKEAALGPGSSPGPAILGMVEDWYLLARSLVPAAEIVNRRRVASGEQQDQAKDALGKPEDDG